MTKLTTNFHSPSYTHVRGEHCVFKTRGVFWELDKLFGLKVARRQAEGPTTNTGDSTVLSFLTMHGHDYDRVTASSFGQRASKKKADFNYPKAHALNKKQLSKSKSK